MKMKRQKVKSLLKRMKEKSEKVGLKLSIQKTKIMVCGCAISSWQIDGEKWKQWQISFLELQNHWGW